MTARVLELVFPAQARYLVLARLGLTGFAPVARLQPGELADLKLAVTEACANAVRHAYPEGEHGPVRVRIALDDSELQVEVADAGTGIDSSGVHAVAPGASLTFEHERVEREGGMGLAIIRSVVDELEIGSPASGGTCVRFTKRLAPV